MKKPKPSFGKDQIQIAKEWNDIVATRTTQIETGVDISYHHILLPCVFSLISEIPTSKFDAILDAGCGSGHLTAKLSELAEKVMGVDISAKSIQIASEKYKSLENVNFVKTSVEEYSVGAPHLFSLAVANMTLMSCLSLENTIGAISSLLDSNAHFVFTIAHPWFWPYHVGYMERDWFKYNSEIPIEAPFLITRDRKGEYMTTYIHRPLEQYINTLSVHGLLVEKFIEPIPDEDVVAKYGTPQEFPRFIGIRCKKQ